MVVTHWERRGFPTVLGLFEVGSGLYWHCRVGLQEKVLRERETTLHGHQGRR